jgi:integrase
VIDGYLLPEFGDRPLESITPDSIDAYKERMITEGRLSARVIVRHLTVLHGVFKRAGRVWGLKRNPAAADLVERPPVVYTGEFTTLDRDELELLARAVDDRQDAAIYKVAAFTGLRQGELLGLRWGDVDFVAGLVHVRRNYTSGREKVPKGKKVRSVPMTPDVLDTLGRLKEREHFTADGDLVFCQVTGAHLDPSKLRRRFKRALERAGLRRIRFHDLRHHFGSAAITVLDGYAVQSYMGHAHYTTTQRYLHHKPRREDAQRLHGAFGGERVPNDVPNEADSGATERN